MGLPRIIVCSHCGAVRSPHEAVDPGIGILSRLARVGLGPGARPVLSLDEGGG